MLSASVRPRCLLLLPSGLIGVSDKETWEPLLEDLRNLQLSNPSLRARGWMTEAWAVDCVSHGDSAILNEEKLRVDDGFHSA